MKESSSSVVILFCPVTFNLAETTRMIEVARALGPGHRAVFMGYEDDFVPLITATGFEYHGCEPRWSAADRDRALRFDQGRALRSPFTPGLVAARVAVERSMIREYEVRAVVTGANVTSMISARAEAVPLFFPVPFALTRPHVEQTARMSFVAGERTAARLVDRTATAIFRWVYNHAPLAPRAFARVARQNGLAPLRTVSSLLEADLNLLTAMPWELTEYTLPDNYVRVGPIFAHLDEPLPEIVPRLAADDAPLIYLGLGSSASRDLALAAAHRLATLPINVVAPIRHYLRPGDALPPNVHVTGLLPAHRLGGLIDAAVLHGGQGTVQTACATGVPFVGMGLQPEQRWNVAACVRRGNAIALRPKDAGTTRLTDAVGRLLSEPGFAIAAERIRAEFAAEDGAAAGARVIEQHLADSGPQPI